MQMQSFCVQYDGMVELIKYLIEDGKKRLNNPFLSKLLIVVIILYWRELYFIINSEYSSFLTIKLVSKIYEPSLFPYEKLLLSFLIVIVVEILKNYSSLLVSLITKSAIIDRLDIKYEIEKNRLGHELSQVETKRDIAIKSSESADVSYLSSQLTTRTTQVDELSTEVERLNSELKSKDEKIKLIEDSFNDLEKTFNEITKTNQKNTARFADKRVLSAISKLNSTMGLIHEFREINNLFSNKTNSNSLKQFTGESISALIKLELLKNKFDNQIELNNTLTRAMVLHSIEITDLGYQVLEIID